MTIGFCTRADGFISVLVHVCVYLFMSLCVCACASVFACVCVCLCVCERESVRECVCVCVSVCQRKTKDIAGGMREKVPIPLDGIRTCTSGIRAHRAADYATRVRPPRIS